VHLEGQLRRHDGGLRGQQAFVRPAINYQLSRAVGFSGGYAYVSTNRYGEYPASAGFPEHRIYQQATVNHKGGGQEFQHRFRLEQRWIGQTPPAAADTWRYQNRFRYMIRTTVPLRAEGWFLAFSNEIFLNYRPRHGARTFDQNRAYAGLGRRIARETNFEVGYLQQTVLQRSATVLELNHTIQLGIFSRLPFGGGSGNQK
jgi:hypothetical protein